MKRFGALWVAVGGLAACVSVSERADLAPVGTPVAQVTVMRAGVVATSMGNTYLGENDVYFAELGPSQRVTFEMAAGTHVFQLRMSGARGFQMPVQLVAGQTHCFAVRRNAKMYWGLLSPLATVMVTPHVLEAVDCPDAGALAAYEAVSVAGQTP